MKISSNVLGKFLDKVSIDGRVEEAVLNFNEQGVSCKAVGLGNIVMLDSLLKKDSFNDYEPIGEVGIKEISSFKDIVKSFVGEIDITKKDNYLYLRVEDKEGHFVLPNIEFMRETREFPQVEHAVSFGIKKDIFINSMNNASLLKTSLYTLKLDNKVLNITVGEQDFLVETRKLETSFEGIIEMKVGDVLGKVMKGCEEKIKCSIGEKVPLLVEDTEDKNIQSRYIIAPILD